MKKAVFLDRDGVINEVLTDRVKFVNKPKDVYLLPGAAEGIRSLNEAGFFVFVVTNQGGIGLGFMKESALHAIHREIEWQLAEESARIDAFAYCPHKPKAGCRCRKPNPGMIEDLAQKYDVDLKKSFMVGDMETDMETDMEAGKRAGIGCTILIGADESVQYGDFRAYDLKEAAEIMLRKVNEK